MIGGKILLFCALLVKTSGLETRLVVVEPRAFVRCWVLLLETPSITFLLIITLVVVLPLLP